MNKNKITLSILLIALLVAGCQKKNTNLEPVDEPTVKNIELTKQQFETGKMELGQPLEHNFSEVVSSKGFLKAAPDGIAQVGVFISGNVNSIHRKSGEWVKKGDLLFKLTGKEIIEIQQDYIQNNAKLTLAKMDMERMKTLVEENISAQKEYQTALSEYQILKAANEALNAKLTMLHLNPEKIVSGNLVTAVSVLAPISGYITLQNITVGEFLEPGNKIMEIIDIQKLQLNLFVFEKDLKLLQPGQKVLFNEPDRKTELFEATLSVIGKSIDQESKTIPCVATIINDNNHQFVHGMYAECSIITSERIALALPSEAIVKDGYSHFVLVKISNEYDMMTFSKQPVEIGREELDFTEVLTPGLTNVLTSGLYNLTVEE